ncbi:hypothetical protein NDU88_010902 [Pleurodeles waltl]|uniref:Uncharacterized protein n=1 Tax=Pleurodeles waltl TaxID=8319 RepID=A0AAV7R040_PLEWA|nr:hypothetical protein NDU88_010902 [Pleurodeles waltl]
MGKNSLGPRSGTLYHADDFYTVPDVPGGGLRDLVMDLSVEEPLRVELLAIQVSRVALEDKIETVTLEVNLLSTDLWNVSDMVRVAEGSIVDPQSEVAALRKQMDDVTSKAATLEATAEIAAGRSRCNNLRLLGFNCFPG